MNESGEQMLNKWFALEPVRNGDMTGQRFDVSRDGEKPMRDLEPETIASAQTDAHVHAELATAGDRFVTLGSELVLVGDQSDVVEGQATADAQNGRVVEDDVTAPSYAVARLLEIATSNADALVEKAREEADQLQTQARARAEQILLASLADAEAREASMSAREEEQRARLEGARADAARGLEARCAEVEDRVDQLLEFEGQLRTYLLSYFNEQTEMLHRSPVVTLMATAPAAASRAG